MDIFNYIKEELNARVETARRAYETVKVACETFNTSEEEYIQSFMSNNFNPITFTTTNSTWELVYKGKI